MNPSRPDNFQRQYKFKDGPLAAYAEQFRTHLERQQYRKPTIYDHLKCVDTFSQLLKRRGVDIRTVNEPQLAGLLQDSKATRLRGTRPVSILKNFVHFLCEIGVTKPQPPPPPDESARARLKVEWEDYLRRQRGVSEGTIKNSWSLVSRFLTFCFGEEGCNLSEISAADVTAFMYQAALRPTPLRDKASSSHLRNFCLFLFQTNRTATNLAPCVFGLAHRYAARLPRHITAEQVEAILAAVKEDTPTGRRNYAMVLLLARLGLRAEEVVVIQLDDIDWRAGELLVPGKGKRHDRLPIPTDVGPALAEYIRRDRATMTRSLFVTERAPRVGFTNGQILNTILRTAFAKTGLQLPVPWVGAHVLRHSVAVSLVRKGASLDEIADMLRHRSRATTLLYARLDMGGLRSVALPWPTKEDVQ